MTSETGAPMADLEIRIFRRNDNGYPVEITLGGQQEFPRGVLDAGIEAWSASGDLAEDGQRLFETFLADAALRSAWDTARGQCPQRRIRLRIDPTATKLHTLPWELLCEGETLLATHADTPFSRYLPIALPWGGAVEDRPIRVLVTISNPANLDQYNLASLDVAQERETLEAALTEVDNLTVTFLEPPITLERLEAALRKGYHIWHYLGHGVYSPRRRQAALYLQDAQGQIHVTPDDELAGVLHRLEMSVKPQLVFLAACESAVRDTKDAFRGLGPKLVAIGVPAVMAMQDTVSIGAARKFSTTFYTRLLEHGLVDQASNEARSTLRTAGQPDVVVPVLFMRLKSGQLWSAEADARGKLLGSQSLWTTLQSRVEDRTCVPIIGPHIHGRWLPPPYEIAQLWANRKRRGYPFGDKENLAHVAQYFDATGGDDWSRTELLKTLAGQFRARLPEALHPRGRFKTLTALVRAVLEQSLPPSTPDETPPAPGWGRLSAGDPNEPHQVLARLDLPLYVTTNCDSFMYEALVAEGKKPRRAFCHWHDGIPSQDAEDYEPTPEAPLVYHLFGSDEQRKSLVVSEDHYLDFLSNVLITKGRIPYSIRSILALSALMFVGYQRNDWEFRVVMRGLVQMIDFKNDYRHVAVQLENVSDETEDEVREFIQNYFGKTKINVFWGSPMQFIAELREQQAYWDEGGL